MLKKCWQNSTADQNKNEDKMKGSVWRDNWNVEALLSLNLKEIVFELTGTGILNVSTYNEWAFFISPAKPNYRKETKIVVSGVSKL